jgi:two-component system, NtrC family, response regulator HydG
MKKHQANILVVDDDEHVTITSKMILKQYFENIDVLASPKSLEAKLKERDYDIILLDMNFKPGTTSGNEGIFWLNRIQSLSPHTQVVLQTAYSDIELAVKSIKEGAVDFLAKPWDKEKLVSTLFNAYQQSLTRKENRSLKNRQKAFQEHINQNHRTFIASSAAMLPVLSTINHVARTEANVLILGENGAGKEVVARSIHSLSDRAEESFISVDLGAIPHSLFESEMFGYEKGAFTDAREMRIGKFELANKGTLFLDEIGNLPAELQVKLLTVLDSRSLSRLGSNEPIQLDVRVVCATNAGIHELVRQGIFRQDLFYRINTVEIQLPPLRERKEDIPLLVSHYLEEFSKRYHRSLRVDDAVMEQLSRYRWPGNIRELRHAVERAVILCAEPDLRIHDFHLNPMTAGDEPATGTLNLAAMEKEIIGKAFNKHRGNMTKIAEELGIGRTTLYRKIDEYGLIP